MIPDAVKRWRPAIPTLARRRSVTLFLAGEAVSVIGDGLEQVALLWFTLQVTGSGAAVGLVLAAFSLPTLLFTFSGGILVDRLDLRRLLTATEGFRAAVALSLGVIVWLTRPELPLLVAYALLMGVGRAMFSPAREVLLVGLVPRAELPALNGLVASNRQLAQLAGPALGGVLVAVAGYPVAFAVNALTFAVSLATIRLLETPVRTPAAEDRSVRQEMAEAFGYLRHAGGIFHLVVLFSLLNVFLAAANATLPQYVHQRLGNSVQSYGAITSFLAIGLLLGSVANGSLGGTAVFHTWRGRLVLFSTAALGLATVGLGWSVVLPLALALSLLRGLAVATANANSLILFQTHVPAALRGRVFGLMMTAGAALAPIGYAVGGAVSGTLGAGETLVFIGALVTAVTVVAAASAPLRRLQTAVAG